MFFVQKKIKMENFYKKIFMGASLSTLIRALYEKEKCLIIEKSNYVGGAWNASNKEFKNLDLACHLIVPPNKNEALKIKKYFKFLNVNLRQTTKKEFYADTNSWKSYGKNGPAMICEQGWPKLLTEVYKKILLKKNIDILFNQKVNKIEVKKNFAFVKTNKDNFNTQLVYFPSYFSVNKITIDKKKFSLPGKKITNIHFVIIFKGFSKMLVKNFQGFWSKNDNYLFDRISVSEIKKQGQISKMVISARLGKKFKRNYKKIKSSDVSNYLLNNKIVETITDIKIKPVLYDCYYRDANDRIKTKKSIMKSNKKIEWFNTTYFGHFLSDIMRNFDKKNHII